MDIEQIKKLKSYEIVETKKIEEIDSLGILLKHKKTGANILVFANDDNNKVFSVGFRTPVEDETGVPHIIEHTVLCGSKKYPLKDPFMELVKGSMNTFINAMTYPDKTVYPVASTNNQDFKNLMSVYMDAVFNPNIYDEEKIFKQEGWHYEIESAEDELKINGIVYSEMKGVHSSVDGVMERVTFRSLFPDTTYNYESGGYPDSIPDLTYDNYLDFHRRYYHPSNSYIYLYGDMDVVERLEWIDTEYLSNYDYLEIDSHVDLQKPFDHKIKKEFEYAITDDQKENENYIFSKNYVIGKSNDVKLEMAIKLIQYAIMDMPGAPLKQALLDAGIAKDIYSTYEQDIVQPVFSIYAKFASGEDEAKFEEIVDTTLKQIVKDGIDKKAIKAGLFGIEFEDREKDFGVYPKGLMYYLRLMSAWLYDEKDAWTLLETNKITEEVKQLVEGDYLEKIIEQYLINNNHCSLVTMVPKKGLTARKEQELKERLAAQKASMTDAEIEQLIKETKELKQYQEEPTSKEALETIPLLEIDDLDKKAREFKSQKEEVDGVKFLYTDIFTNGIGYVSVNTVQEKMPKEYLPYLRLMKKMLGGLDTESHGYGELNALIGTLTGGFSLGTVTALDLANNKLRYRGEIRIKTFYNQMKESFDLAKEILFTTKFDDCDRIKVILEETKSTVYSNILERGDVVGGNRVLSYSNKYYYYLDMVSGIGFYDFLCDLLDNYDVKKEQFVAKLQEVIRYAFAKNNIVVSYAGNKESYEAVKELALDIINQLGENTAEVEDWDIVKEIKNEAFITPGQVQFVSRGGNYLDLSQEEYDGALNVLGGIMRKDYLWNNVRVLGGAYGCFNKISKDGTLVLSSYRDPNLKSTSDTFINSDKYVANFEVDERDMRKYIIGAISELDRPLSTEDICSRELGVYISNVKYEDIQRERDQVLSATVEDIRKLADYYTKAMEPNAICVIGSKAQIEENKYLFDDIRVLV